MRFLLLPQGPVRDRSAGRDGQSSFGEQEPAARLVENAATQLVHLPAARLRWPQRVTP